jgi:hypothetical protein
VTDEKLSRLLEISVDYALSEMLREKAFRLVENRFDYASSETFV